MGTADSVFCIFSDSLFIVAYFFVLVYMSLNHVLIYFHAYAMSRAGTTPKVIYGLLTPLTVVLVRSNLLVNIVMVSPFSRMPFPLAWMNPVYLSILFLNFWMIPRYHSYHHCCYKYGFSDTCTQ